MSAGIVGGFIGLLIWFFLALIALAVCVFWIWMLIHALTNKALSGMDKLVWVLVILFLHGLGALIYFFVGRERS